MDYGIRNSAMHVCFEKDLLKICRSHLANSISYRRQQIISTDYEIASSVRGTKKVAKLEIHRDAHNFSLNLYVSCMHCNPMYLCDVIIRQPKGKFRKI